MTDTAEGTNKETSYLRTDMGDKLHMSKQTGDDGEEGDDNLVSTTNPGCGVIGQYPLISLLIAAILGIGVGIGLNYWEPDND